jgi:hypothetical protein
MVVSDEFRIRELCYRHFILGLMSLVKKEISMRPLYQIHESRLSRSIKNSMSTEFSELRESFIAAVAIYGFKRGK